MNGFIFLYECLLDYKSSKRRLKPKITKILKHLHSRHLITESIAFADQHEISR